MLPEEAFVPWLAKDEAAIAHVATLDVRKLTDQSALGRVATSDSRVRARAAAS